MTLWKVSKASLYYYFPNKTMIDEIICLIVSLINYISSNDINIFYSCIIAVVSLALEKLFRRLNNIKQTSWQLV